MRQDVVAMSFDYLRYNEYNKSYPRQPLLLSQPWLLPLSHPLPTLLLSDIGRDFVYYVDN